MLPPRAPRTLALTLACVALGAAGPGCTGGATSTSGGGAGPASGGKGGGSTGLGGGTSSPGTGGAVYDPAVASCPTRLITPSPLRRLTRREYANTVRDLLAVDPTPANDLPVDEVTEGFDNNAGVLTVSSLHAEKYVLVSEALAKAAVENLAALNDCDTKTKGEDACAQSFARSFGRRAFRRPTTPEDEQLLMTAYAAGRDGGSYGEGLEVMIRAALQSSSFLYRLELGAPTANAPLVPLSQYELATRLSYLVWASMPDDALLDAAARNELATKDMVATKVRAMLKDARARRAVTSFYDQWMSTSRLEVITKDRALFPRFSAELQAGMTAELPAFVNYVLYAGDRTLKTLLTSQLAFVNPALAAVYGVTAPASAANGPVMVSLPASQGRSGILTQAGFLAVQAHPDQTSPVLRGKFVRAKLLCQPPQPPPPNANVTPPDVSAAATARERFKAHEQAGADCAGCHVLMDPIGLAFENFDAVGAYRTEENGKTIDASGQIFAANDSGLGGAFKGVRQLADKLATSRQVSDCVATQWFRWATGRLEETPDGCSLANLRDGFAASGSDLVELIVATTQTDAFWYRAPSQP